MERPENENLDIDRQIAQRLRGLRAERGWSLEELARRSGVSRATLSRLENAEVSATATVLGKLCSAYGMTLSRLIRSVGEAFAPLVARDDQPVWRDVHTGFDRRSVSPPGGTLAGEVLECRLEANTEISYDAPPRAGLEHHLIVLEGALHIIVEGHEHALSAGDCLRYHLFGSSGFRTGAEGARYFLFLV